METTAKERTADVVEDVVAHLDDQVRRVPTMWSLEAFSVASVGTACRRG